MLSEDSFLMIKVRVYVLIELRLHICNNFKGIAVNQNRH